MQDWLVSNLRWIFSGIGVAVLVGLVNFIRRQIRRRTIATEQQASFSTAAGRTRQQPIQVEILPLSFEATLRQEIPRLTAWLYVVNHSRHELVIRSLDIPHFNFTGGPAIDKISSAGQPRIPAFRSSQLPLMRSLGDAEARAIERSQQRNPANATFIATLTAKAGKKEIELETLQLSSNGWIAGVSTRE